VTIGLDFWRHERRIGGAVPVGSPLGVIPRVRAGQDYSQSDYR